MKKKIMIMVSIVMIAIVSAIFYLGITPSTREFKDENGKVISDSIAVLEELELGNMKQWISIRGKDISNPVLLWLHGGPGSAQMSLAYQSDKRLEEEFVVVHWDQRGAGKSNHAGFDESTMTVEQFKNDARELIDYLRSRLDKEKIFLLGHSWGSQLGIELVHEYPEYFYAYIGVSQVVDNRRAVDIAYAWLRQKIEDRGDEGDLQKLEAIEGSLYKHSEYRKLAQLVAAYGGNMDKEMWRLALISVKAPEYTFVDYVRMFSGMHRGGGPMHRDGKMAHFNYIEKIPSIDVPTIFLVGQDDYNTPLKLVEEYYERLQAPQKDLILFENSAHTPFWGETEKFNQEMRQVKEKMHP